MAKKPVRVEPTAPIITPAPIIAPNPLLSDRSYASMLIYATGFMVALLAGIVVSPTYTYATYAVLAILGFIVGLVNITEDEVLMFLVATVAFVVATNSVRTVLEAVPAVQQVLSNVIIFTAASAFIVSLRALIKVSKSA